MNNAIFLFLSFLYSRFIEVRSFDMAGNVGGLLLRWYSMNFSPDRQHNSEPKAEDNYKR
jgi:hypothetical protein